MELKAELMIRSTHTDPVVELVAQSKSSLLISEEMAGFLSREAMALTEVVVAELEAESLLTC